MNKQQAAWQRKDMPSFDYDLAHSLNEGPNVSRTPATEADMHDRVLVVALIVLALLAIYL